MVFLIRVKVLVKNSVLTNVFCRGNIVWERLKNIYSNIVNDYYYLVFLHIIILKTRFYVYTNRKL